MTDRPVYFDYNATTPLDPAVREAMLPYLAEVFGNPSSVHALGRRARAVLDESRERVAETWACKPGEVVFTSGGTESINLALLGAARRFRDRGRHIITSRMEHHAVLHACEYLVNKEGFALTCLPVDPAGKVPVDSVREALRPDTILVSVMAANNEVGSLQDVAQVGTLCRDRGVLFHTDAVQWLGKEPFHAIAQFEADLVSACAHKFHGPKGAGALFIRSPLRIDPILLGGSHEDDRRAGTENLAAIVGFAEATTRFVRNPVFPADRLRPLSRILSEAIADLAPRGVRLWGSPAVGLANTVAFTVAGCDSISLLASLDLEGICASSGSACSSGALEPSHVILALGGSPAEAHSLVRFSLGRETTEEEVRRAIGVLGEIIGRVQSFGNGWGLRL